MQEEYVNQSVMILTVIISIVTINRLNPAVSDFFQSPFIIFLVITLYLYKRNKNILVAMSSAFFFTVFVGVVTMPDVMEKTRETFELIFPTPNTHPECVDIKIANLLEKFDGDEAKLKQAMDESSVPYNLSLSDENAPEIATYLINNPRIKNIGEKCKL